MPFVALSTGEKTEQHIRKRFREWFEASGQTQKEAGQAIEWEQQTVSSYFNGNQQIDFVRAIAWCDHFNKSLEQLLAKSPRPKTADPGLQTWVNTYNGQDEQGRKTLLGFIGTMQRGRRAPKDRSGRS
jgi:transcriptional regulator with XRE-family HTH domain